MEYPVDLHRQNAVVLTAADYKADASETAQGIFVVGCAAETLLFIIMEHSQATAVIGRNLIVRILVGRLACEVPSLGI